MTRSLVETAIAPDFASWRAEARALLHADVSPDSVVWRDAADAQQSLIGAMASASSERTSATAYAERLAHRFSAADPVLRDGRFHVPKGFMRIAREVACYRDVARWDALYRVLWRLTHGERELLDVATDPDVHRIDTMVRGVRRAVHKMHAFVRFKAVPVSSTDDVNAGERLMYVAWFEPPHPVVELASPFFARRFPSMRWSVLTPDRCAHWDGASLTYSAGVARELAPKDDSLEELWRTYYASIFNPARLALSAMKAEMPKHYWNGLPEASLIPSLTRDAPARVARMLAKLSEPAERLPEELRAPRRQPAESSPHAAPHASSHRSASSKRDTVLNADLDVPGAWDPVHDPGAAAARARAQRVRASTAGLEVDGASVRIGTASWTDPTLLAPGVFYPEGVASAEERLRYYASRFSLVEVDSTYYAMPARSMAAAWAARSPADFVFDIKAFSLMTGHAAETKRLPDWLRRALPRTVAADTRVRPSQLPTTLMDDVWARFLAALSPLRDAGKLGPILLQYPRWFTPTRESADALRAARERLGDEAAAVEFRNPAWLEGRMAARTIALLEKLELTYVVVDAPPGTGSSMPPTLHVTTPGFAMVRLHGRRTAAWEAKHAVVSERYRYLYDGEELQEWAARIGELARSTRAREGMPDMAKAKQGVHVVYNNCHANYGTTNASEITELLIEFDRERRLI